MEENNPAAKSLSFEQLAEVRQKTDVVSAFLRRQLASYLETLRPLLIARRLFGKHAGGREEVAGAEQLLAQLRAQYEQVCGAPFNLPQELDPDAVVQLENRLDLYPWEYSYELKGSNERKTVLITSPVRWVLGYTSGYTMSQLRATLTGQTERRTSGIRQFLVGALVMRLVFDKHPGLGQILSDLRFQVHVEKVAGLGSLPLVTISSCVSSFRPEDSFLMSSTSFSGVPAFIELVDMDTVHNLQDPIRVRLDEALRAQSSARSL